MPSPFGDRISEAGQYMCGHQSDDEYSSDDHNEEHLTESVEGLILDT